MFNKKGPLPLLVVVRGISTLCHHHTMGETFLWTLYGVLSSWSSLWNKEYRRNQELGGRVESRDGNTESGIWGSGIWNNEFRIWNRCGGPVLPLHFFPPPSSSSRVAPVASQLNHNTAITAAPFLRKCPAPNSIGCAQRHGGVDPRLGSGSHGEGVDGDAVCLFWTRLLAWVGRSPSLTGAL